MANTLDIDDEWGPVDVVKSLETAFAVTFADAEVCDVWTVGAVYDLLLAKVPCDGGRKCAGAMAFYRLRRALADLRDGTKLTPQTDLAFLGRGRTKRHWKALEKAAGLKLPGLAMAWETAFGAAMLAALVGMPLLLAALVLKIFAIPFGATLAQISFCLLGCFVLGLAIAVIDPGRLPENARTLGDLAHAVADRNYRHFPGVKCDDATIWRVMLAALADHTSLPFGEVTRETTFLKNQPKHAA